VSDTIHDSTTLDEAPPRRLVRVDEGRWLGGVAAGLGRYFDVNPLIYRIAFAALALAGGTGLLLYLAAYLVIPGEHDDDSLSEARFWPGTGNVWLAATLVGGALVWWHVSNRERAPRQAAPTTEAPMTEAPVTDMTATETTTAETTAILPTAPPRAPKPPRRPSLFAPVLGALLAAAGLFGLLAVLDIYEVDVAVALALAVFAVGGAIAVGAATRRRVGGLVFLGLVLLAAFGVAASTPTSISAGVGDKNERPLTVTALEPSYEQGLGTLDLDLSAVSLPAGTTSVDANVGIGRLVITVPAGVALRIDAQAGIGDVNVLGARDDGIDADRTIVVPGSSPSTPVLDVEADVGLGGIEVRRG
jgi:phage shock protein PspC (stress-responsive transcriptional regulator)